MDTYSVGRRSKGYAVADPFDGLPRRWVLRDATLIEKRRCWRENTTKTTSARPPAEVLERRAPDHGIHAPVS